MVSSTPKVPYRSFLTSVLSLPEAGLPVGTPLLPDSVLAAEFASIEHSSSSFSYSMPTALQRAKMEQPTRAQSWVKVPQHRQWGFEEPSPELLKIVIDLRAKEQQPVFQPPPEREHGSSLASMLSHHQQAKARDSGSFHIFTAYSQQNLQIRGEQSSGSYVPELFVCLLTQAHFVS